MKDEFGFEKNEFYFSGGVTGYDGKSYDITDLQIGQIKIYRKWWTGGADETNSGTSFTELETEFCSPDDITPKNGNTTLYKVSEFSATDFYIYYPRLKCLKNPNRDLKLQGNFDTSST